MITVAEIRNGESYMKNHLSQNDYYSEKETVVGEWWGEGAKRLGLEGQHVTAETFEALRNNQHPLTREKLTPRSRLVAFHDVVVSAPKSFSIMAQVGGDERLVKAFEEASKLTFQELERFAAVRVRHGEYAKTEAYRFTGNAVAAVYHHDTSRLLDPQHHHHFVFANLSYDEKTQRWLALQRRPMMEASKASVRQFFHRELARLTKELGYDIEWTKNGFRLKEISLALEQKFSTRALQREAFEKRYRNLFKNDPSKARIEQFIKEGKGAARKRFQVEFEKAFRCKPSSQETEAFVQDWRSSKMAYSSRAKVRAGQLEKLSPPENQNLKRLLAKALSLSSGAMGEEGNSERLEHRQQVEEEPKAQDGSQGVAHESSHSMEDLSFEPTHQLSKKVIQKRHQPQHLARQRMEVLRRYRRGMILSAALRGYPGSFFASQLTQLAHKHKR